MVTFYWYNGSIASRRRIMLRFAFGAFCMSFLMKRLLFFGRLNVTIVEGVGVSGGSTSAYLSRPACCQQRMR